MKYLMLFLLLIIQIFAYSQPFKKDSDAGGEFYRLSLHDTTSLNQLIPDGRWKVFENDSIVCYQFHVIANKITGPYYRRFGCTNINGNYLNDSLKTFLSNPEDSTFKIGIWQQKNICDMPIWSENDFGIPFNTKDSTFTEKWIYNNGNISMIRIHDKGRGLLEEKYFYYDTGNLRFHKSNKEQYSIIESYNELGKLTFLALENADLKLDWDLYNDTTRYSPKHVSLNFKNDSVYKELYDCTIDLDENNRVTGFYDRFGPVQYHIYKKSYSLYYDNRKGKRKIKYIRRK